MRVSSALACAVLAGQLTMASSARAGDADLADALFEEARALIAAKRYDEACTKLAESEALDPGIGTQFNLARCYELSGRTASAWAVYVRVIGETRAAGQLAREDAARLRLADLAPKLCHLRVRIAPDAQLPGLRVSLDGVILPRERWGEGGLVDPGPHTITAQAEGHEEWSRTVEVAETHVASVDVPALIATAPAVDAGRSPAPPDAHAPPNDPSLRRVVAWSAFGAGIGAVGAGIAFVLRSNSLYSATAPDCIGNTCNLHGFNQRNDAIRSGNIATVLLIAGGAAFTAGCVLLLTAPSSHAPSLQAAMTFSPDRGTVVLGSSW